MQEAISNLVQPHIVALGSVLEYERLLISIEVKEFCTVTNNTCFDAILV